MQTPDPNADLRPEAAFLGAAERFFDLLRDFGAAPSGEAPDWAQLARPLAGQFAEWLRLSQAAAPWFAAAGGAFGNAGATGFAPLPLGPQAPFGADVKRLLDLCGRLAQLQGQLAAHWSEIANTAAQRFVADLGGATAPPADVDAALRLYERWVRCAEEAYAVTAHHEEFARLQAELANVYAALFAEQRRQAQAFVRTLGLPGRAELDALADEVRELRRRVDAPGAKASPPSRAHTPRETGKRGTRGKSRVSGKARASGKSRAAARAARQPRRGPPR